MSAREGVNTEIVTCGDFFGIWINRVVVCGPCCHMKAISWAAIASKVRDLI